MSWDGKEEQICGRKFINYLSSYTVAWIYSMTWIIKYRNLSNNFAWIQGCNNPIAMARAAGPAPVTGPTIRDYLNRDRPSLWVVMLMSILIYVPVPPSYIPHMLTLNTFVHISHTHAHLHSHTYTLTHLHACTYREEATDIIKSATKKVGSGALAAWEEEQNDVSNNYYAIYNTTPNNSDLILVCLYCMCHKRYREELRRERVKRLGEASGSRGSSKSRDSKKKKKVILFP